MKLARLRLSPGTTGVGVVEGDRVRVLDLSARPGVRTLSDILHSPDPPGLVADLLKLPAAEEAYDEGRLLAPVDRQEVWAAGVTYRRSKVAREEESAGAAQFYDKVYTAARPELFLKATPERVVGPGGPVRVRRDSSWSVPEPELALVISPDLRVVGYTIGNDLSARDIEGENPLYLPQAKIYDGSCSVGPVVTLAAAFPPLDQVDITLTIHRGGEKIFEGDTNLSRMARTPESLVEWLGKETSFPAGAVLLTGTGIVPPDEFCLKPGDRVAITVTGIGTLNNPVA
ncbi:MAG TPA: fumarylacetoacetate hydrolase family protein [Gemmataceae bacterium]